MADLDRFVVAQTDSYDAALAELKAGRKIGHWMWFIFPQLKGLGRSSTAEYYAIDGRGEAENFVAHSLLGARLHECIDATLPWSGTKDAIAIFGDVDAVKFRSSMTLFAAAGERAADEALSAFFDGQADPLTVKLLTASSRVA